MDKKEPLTGAIHQRQVKESKRGVLSMGIISLFRADVDSRIEKRLTALESAIADLPAKISAAEKKVIWDLFEKDFDAITKGSNATVREIRDLPEKFAAYAKIYLKAALKEIDPEAVAAELDEAEGLLAAFMEEAKKIVEAKERENKKVAYMAELEDAPAGWATIGDLAKKHNLSTSRVSFILRESCIEKKLLARTIVTRTLSKKWHYDEAKANKLIAEFEAEEAKRRNENE